MEQTISSGRVDRWKQLIQFRFLGRRSSLIIDDLHERRYRLQSKAELQQNWPQDYNHFFSWYDIKRQHSTDPSPISIYYTVIFREL